MALSVADKILIAKKSQFLANSDIYRQGIRNNAVDWCLPKKIYSVRKNTEWMYVLDPDNESLDGVSNYLYGLCGKYALAAQALTGGGSIAQIGGSSVPQPVYFIVSASSYLPSGTNSSTLSDFAGMGLVFSRNGILQTTVQTEPTWFTWDRTTAEFSCSPSLQTDELVGLIPV